MRLFKSQVPQRKMHPELVVLSLGRLRPPENVIHDTKSSRGNPGIGILRLLQVTLGYSQVIALLLWVGACM